MQGGSGRLGLGDCAPPDLQPEPDPNGCAPTPLVRLCSSPNLPLRTSSFLHAPSPPHTPDPPNP